MSGRDALGLSRCWLAVRVVATTACGLFLPGMSPVDADGRSGDPAAADTLRVTLSAPEGGAVAEGTTGHFTVSVAGSTEGGAVTVRYSVSGTATAGMDYAALSGEVTVPQGEAAAL